MNSSGPPFPPTPEHPYNVNPVLISIIGALGSIFLVVGYYHLLLKYCSCFENIIRRRMGGIQQGSASEDDLSGPGLDHSLIAKIPILKYDARNTDSGNECSVCLTEFTEGELVRVLPKCRHAFHISCIGLWLNTHSNCPLCRANIATSLNDSLFPEKHEDRSPPTRHEIEPRRSPMQSHSPADYNAPPARVNAVEMPLPRSFSYAGSSHLPPEGASSSQWYQRFRWSARRSSPSREEMRSRLLDSDDSFANKDLEVGINFDRPVNISNGG
ncbi:hypothetical protein SUGI_0034340 [Cryptomeria japonica]|uniref:RING-H2 finger protein ATL52 n=1 Tax=Cryptomeria japonica TaxID=3369 RepID=UPI002408EB00|nr:RING-H2 finger protein ATL52 [Cryptomeria japonica]GLJ06250.1 hypothetical protein SUGI_0034340 [Cryptomeria japonica]